MMNPGQYPGMRYPIHYPGMEHPQHPMPHMHQMHQQQPPPASTSVFSDAPSLANISDEGSVPQQQPQPQEGDGVSAESSPQEAPQQPPPPPPPQHHMPMQQPFMHYPVGYYNPAMGMHPQIHPQQFMHPHMAALMQRQMYPMQAGMPPNMMRAPPYYPGPNGPMPYPMYGGGGYGEEDGLNNNGRGRGRGGTRGGRTARGQGRGSGMGARIGGRGRHGYPYSGGSGSQPDSGRTTPQDQQSHATEHAPVSEEIASSPSKDDTQFRPSETAPSTEIVSSNGGGK